MPNAMVVDDSRAVRMIIGRTLRELGFDVIEAAHGRQALDSARRRRARRPGSGRLEYAGDGRPGVAAGDARQSRYSTVCQSSW